MSGSVSMGCNDVVARQEAWTQQLPDKRSLQKRLLVATTVSAIFSLIPSYRISGAIAGRVSALLSVGLNASDADSRSGFIASIGKCAVLVLGIAAVALEKPVFFTASLVADIAVHAFQLAKNVYDRDCTGFLDFSIIVIDAFALAAVTTGSWPFMVTALAVSTLVMLGACCVNLDTNEDVDLFCYLALFCTTLVATHEAAKFDIHKPTKYVRAFVCEDDHCHWDFVPTEFVKVGTHEPLAAQHYPTLPLVGTTIVQP